MFGIPEFGNRSFEESLGGRFKEFVNGLPQSILTNMDGDVLLLYGMKRVAQLSVSETHTWSPDDEEIILAHWDKFSRKKKTVGKR